MLRLRWNHVGRLGVMWLWWVVLQTVAFAQCEQEKFAPSDGATSDEFGLSVDVDGQVHGPVTDTIADTFHDVVHAFTFQLIAVHDAKAELFILTQVVTVMKRPANADVD